MYECWHCSTQIHAIETQYSERCTQTADRSKATVAFDVIESEQTQRDPVHTAVRYFRRAADTALLARGPVWCWGTRRDAMVAVPSRNLVET